MPTYKYWISRKSNFVLVASQAALLSLLAAPLILAARPLAHTYFDFVNLRAEKLAQQRVYFNILLNGAIQVLLHTCLSSFFSGIGCTRGLMFSVMTAMVVNILANYGLIFGNFGLPALNLVGRYLGAGHADIAFIIIFSGIFYLRYRGWEGKTLAVVGDGKKCVKPAY